MFRNLCGPALGLSGRESELIEPALSHGFRGLDLDLADVNERVSKNGLPHTRRLIDSAKLRLGCVRLPLDVEADPSTFQQQLAALGGQLEAVAQMGCRAVLTTLAPATDLRPYHENFELHRQRYTAIGQVLEPLGMKLGIAFLAPAEHRRDKSFEFIHDHSALIVLLSMVAATNVGIVLDPWQILAGGGTADDWRKLPIQQIVAVWLADAPEGVAASALTPSQRLLPGTNVIDSAVVLAALAEAGYDGPVSPAPHPAALGAHSREAIVRHAGQALDAVWKAAGLSPAGKRVNAPAKLAVAAGK